ncbi:UNVERIFIED_CONTAM: hypothetical protein K2H54_044981 [Gekko kuhli]
MDLEDLSCSGPGKVSEPHSFKEKVFKKKKKACVVCKESIEAQGLVCKVCKVASHKKCEGKEDAWDALAFGQNLCSDIHV